MIIFWGLLRQTLSLLSWIFADQTVLKITRICLLYLLSAKEEVITIRPDYFFCYINYVSEHMSSESMDTKKRHYFPSVGNYRWL